VPPKGVSRACDVSNGAGASSTVLTVSYTILARWCAKAWGQGRRTTSPVLRRFQMDR